ncbi:MAG TPA: carboxypeptidase regulatory-like domain-containing protein [Candidatus Acidoferrum sp.]|nr:carboxypeptidase regulatory-like domain-containing protein [Candidatus Acidoferrum sp.]
MNRHNAQCVSFRPGVAIHIEERRGRYPRVLFWAILLLLCLGFGANLRADTLSGTVKDPSGLPVAGAKVEISGESLVQPVTLTTDDSGKFAAPDLKPGKYSLRVTKDGFQMLTAPAEVRGTLDVSLTLAIAEQQTTVTVNAKAAAFANSDSFYRQLRDIKLGSSYHCDNFTLPLDVGTFEFKSGTITFLAPVNGQETGAIFLGQGHFTLKPVLAIDTQEMIRRSGHEIAEEEFTEVVFRFSGSLAAQFSKIKNSPAETPGAADGAFERWKNKVRHRHEVPDGFTDGILQAETMDNVDADVLSAVYNPKHPGFINAYMTGAPHKDMRYFIRARTGAIPQLGSPEEVGLINCSGSGMDDGIWYSQHLYSELKARTANSQEDRRLFSTHRYVIETVIGKNAHFASQAKITFEPLVPGDRVLKFGLLPTLRVARVVDENGRDLHFIQEDRKHDGSFYAVLDEAPEMGKEHSITVEYGGDKVLYDAGGGSYYVGARESWYPNLNGFGEKALYDLTFKVPKSNVVISVGKLQGQSEESGFAVSHWVTSVPVAVAGFNYGKYQRIEMPDAITHYDIAGYYLTDLPDNLAEYARGNGPLASMAPKSMTSYALEQARAQMQVCTIFFGKAPYENLAITEQPNFNFGQSWPSLVYLPISAYIDSTQRWRLFGTIDSNFTGFVQEVTPHEVAHQWFGHSVSWASYHDQWLSEGFADFAAGLYLEEATGPKWQKDYVEYWDRQKRRILEKNSYGIASNDAGPLWLGLRLISPKTPRAYQGVTYSKGAYVLLMLKSLMFDDQHTSNNPNQAFIDMMHDFISSHQTTPASTESFKAIAEKHMTKSMDLQGNGKLDWFFREWVYGTQVPRYQFKYEIQPGDGKGVKVHVEITQSEVDPGFAMLVPVYADFGQGMMRLGQVPVVGNSTRPASFLLDQAPKKVAINVHKNILER